MRREYTNIVIDSRYDFESFDPRAVDIYALGMVLCELSLTKFDERRKQEGWSVINTFSYFLRKKRPRDCFLSELVETSVVLDFGVNVELQVGFKHSNVLS